MPLDEVMKHPWIVKNINSIEVGLAGDLEQVMPTLQQLQHLAAAAEAADAKSRSTPVKSSTAPHPPPPPVVSAVVAPVLASAALRNSVSNTPTGSSTITTATAMKTPSSVSSSASSVEFSVPSSAMHTPTAASVAAGLHNLSLNSPQLVSSTSSPATSVGRNAAYSNTTSATRFVGKENAFDVNTNTVVSTKVSGKVVTQDESDDDDDEDETFSTPTADRIYPSLSGFVGAGNAAVQRSPLATATSNNTYPLVTTTTTYPRTVLTSSSVHVPSPLRHTTVAPVFGSRGYGNFRSPKSSSGNGGNDVKLYHHLLQKKQEGASSAAITATAPVSSLVYPRLSEVDRDPLL